MIDGMPRKEADPEFVGLSKAIQDIPFAEQFDQHYKPQLEKRAEGFEILFDALRPDDDMFVVETGCLRIPKNWNGDGQSTFMFDALIRENHGVFFSIDLNLENIGTARRACSSATHLVHNDSVAALHALSRTLLRQVSLLYLDSYDVDLDNPMPSAIHHMMELTAAGPLIGPGTIVCIDDYGIANGGKGIIVDRYLASIRAHELYRGYQKIWRL